MKNIRHILVFSLLILSGYFLFSRFNNVDFKKDSKEGIHFLKGDWKSALAQAKKENKLIFLDVYATWCGPCKRMKSNTFSNHSAGAYFNSNFINVSLDAEEGEGIQVAEQYGVMQYPTLMFIDGDGKLKYETAGYMSVSELIDLGKTVLEQ